MTSNLVTKWNLNCRVVLRDILLGLLQVKLHSGMAFSFKVETILVKNEQKAFATSIGSFTFTPPRTKVCRFCLTFAVVG